MSMLPLDCREVWAGNHSKISANLHAILAALHMHQQVLKTCVRSDFLPRQAASFGVQLGRMARETPALEGQEQTRCCAQCQTALSRPVSERPCLEAPFGSQELSAKPVQQDR